VGEREPVPELGKERHSDPKVASTREIYKKTVNDKHADPMAKFGAALSQGITVGVKARLRQWASGNQYQNWAKSAIPTIEGMLPPLLSSSSSAFLPERSN
jgi:hypothetical protein